MNKKKKSYLPKNNVLQYTPVRAKKKHFLRTTLIVFGVFFVFLGASVSFIFFSNYFKVANIFVEGNRLTDTDTVIRLAENAIKTNSHFAALFGSQNILFWVFTSREQNFSAGSEISRIIITVDFQKKLIFLHSDERTVSYIICRPDEMVCYGVTEAGIVFSQIPRVEGGLMFKIDDETNVPVVLGERYFGNPSFLDVVYKTTQLFLKLDMRPIRIVIRDHALYDWDAIFAHGPVFHFSGTFVPHELPLVIESIKKQASLNSLEYVDFRAENKVYYR